MRKKEYDGDFIEELISIARESTRSYLELIKLRNKARDFLDNLRDAIEAAVEEEIKRSGICPEEKTIHLGEEEPRINIEEDIGARIPAFSKVGKGAEIFI